MRTRNRPTAVAALLSALLLALLTSCASATDYYREVDAVANDLRLSKLPGLIHSERYGENPRVEGNGPSYLFLYRQSSELTRRLEQSLKDNAFQQSNQNYWYGSDLRVRVERLGPQKEYQTPSGYKIEPAATGLLIVTVLG